MSTNLLLSSSEFARNSKGEEAKGVSFDGVSDYLNLNTTSFPNRSTISFWVYVGSDTSFQQIYGPRFDSGKSAIDIYAVNNEIGINFYNSNGGQSSAGSISVPVSRWGWHNVLLSVDKINPSSYPVYVDDAFKGNISLTSDALGTGSNHWIGRIGSTASSYIQVTVK